MELDDLDKKIRESLKGTEMYYAPQANKASARIWDAVEKDEPKNELFWYKWISAAAVILLLFVSSLLFFTIRQTDARNYALKQEMEQLYLIADQQGLNLQSKEEKIQTLISQSQQLKRKALKNAIVVREKVIVKTDTIYIPPAEAIVRVEALPLKVPGQPLITKKADEQVDLMIPEPPKLHFTFADHQKENPKDKKNFSGLKFRFGSGGADTPESWSQHRPLSMHTSF